MFAPFTGKRSLDFDDAAFFRFNFLLIIAWSSRWYLVAVQAVVLIWWLRKRRA
jgi:hypothetical protein